MTWASVTRPWRGTRPEGAEDMGLVSYRIATRPKSLIRSGVGLEQHPFAVAHFLHVHGLQRIVVGTKRDRALERREVLHALQRVADRGALLGEALGVARHLAFLH